MGKLWDFMGKLRVCYGLRFTHKILWGTPKINLIKPMFNQVFHRYGQLWVKAV